MNLSKAVHEALDSIHDVRLVMTNDVDGSVDSMPPEQVESAEQHIGEEILRRLIKKELAVMSPYDIEDLLGSHSKGIILWKS